MKDRLGRLQFNFLPSVSVKSAKASRDKIKAMRIHSYTGSKIEMIAEMLSPMFRGLLNYFTKFNPSATRKKRTPHVSTLGSWNGAVTG
jgi:RNA-directed DNA polymerase